MYLYCRPRQLRLLERLRIKQLQKNKLIFCFPETLGRNFILLKTLSGSYTIMCEICAPPRPRTCQAGMDSGREKAGMMVWEKTVREKCARQLSRTTGIEDKI